MEEIDAFVTDHLKREYRAVPRWKMAREECKLKKWQRGIGIGILTFCCLFTLMSGVFLLTNYENITKLARVVFVIEREFLWDTNTDTLTDGAIIGMLGSLNDKYSNYINEEAMASFRQSISGEVYGIGVFLATDEEGNLVIVSPAEDGPAEAAGIEAGDIIKAVNGTDITGMDEDIVIGMLRGVPEEKVTVTVERNGESYTFTVGRYLIGKTKTVYAEMLPEHPEIAYLRISKFSAQTSQEFVDAVNELPKESMQAMILDLRNNGGGDVNAAVEIARLFVPSGPVLHVVYKNDETESYSATGAQIHLPVAVLVNGNSASASEILAGALKDSNAATLVGTTTFGKGLVQGVYFLNDGTAIKLTQAKYLTPNKNDINGVGISPDVVIDLPQAPSDSTDEESAEEHPLDVQLEKAIEVVKK